MKCRNCTSENCIRKGNRNGVQRYYCKNCNKYFQEKYQYKAYYADMNKMIIRLLNEGCGIRSISRILNISTKTVLSRMLKISKRIKVPVFNRSGCSFEVDELWSFVGNKQNVIWITYAIDKASGDVIDFIVGRKTIENIKPLINKLLLISPKSIYTERLNIYPGLIPKELHKVFQYCTNKIERMNLTLRTHIKRLTRRSICFSKNPKYLEAHLKIYFWG